MSDTSGDSESSVELDAVGDASVYPIEPNHELEHSNDQSDGEGPESESDGEAHDGHRTAMDQISTAIGYTGVLAMQTKLDEVDAWLNGMLQDPFEQICIDKRTILHHRKIVKEITFSFKCFTPKAARISESMISFINQKIEDVLDTTINAVLSSKGTGCTAMRELLKKDDFKSELITEITQILLMDENFFQDIEPKINNQANEKIKILLMEEAEKMSEAKITKKYWELRRETQKRQEAGLEKLFPLTKN